LNTRDYFVWGYLTDSVYTTDSHTVHELQAEIEAVDEEITGDTLCDKIEKNYSSTRSKDLILSMCSYEDHMSTNSA